MSAPAPGANPFDALHRELAAARWARFGVRARAFLIPVMAVASMFFVHQSNLWKQNVALHPGLATPPFPAGLTRSLLWLMLVGLLQLLVLVTLMVWLYRSAVHARDLGFAARFSVFWGWLSWIVPIVSLWFPFVVLSDCLPPTHPGRRIALGWWWLYVLAPIISIVVGHIGASFPVAGAVLVGLMLVYAWFEASKGVATVNVVSEVHRQATMAYAPAQF